MNDGGFSIKQGKSARGIRVVTYLYKRLPDPRVYLLNLIAPTKRRLYVSAYFKLWSLDPSSLRFSSCQLICCYLLAAGHGGGGHGGGGHGGGGHGGGGHGGGGHGGGGHGGAVTAVAVTAASTEAVEAVTEASTVADSTAADSTAVDSTAADSMAADSMAAVSMTVIMAVMEMAAGFITMAHHLMIIIMTAAIHIANIMIMVMQEAFTTTSDKGSFISHAKGDNRASQEAH